MSAAKNRTSSRQTGSSSMQRIKEMDTGLRIIPRLRLATEQILIRAESRTDLITYPSLIKSTGYITDMEDVLVITRNSGYLRIKAGDLKDMLPELEYICEDIERRSRD